MDEQNRIRMLISDVDGTLLNSASELSSETRQAVARCRRAGLKFSVSSARPPYGMRRLIRDLEVESVCSGLNGAVIFHPQGGILVECALDHGTIEAVRDQMQLHGLDVWLYTRDEWFVPRINGAHVRHNAQSLATPPQVYTRLADIAHPILKIVGTSDGLWRLPACALELQRALPQRISVTRSQPHYLDVTHPSADKGTAAIVIATAEEIEINEVAVVGDSEADVPMFRVAGLSVAMGQASDNVRRTAAEVTGTNEENGVALLIDQLVRSKLFPSNGRLSS